MMLPEKELKVKLSDLFSTEIIRKLTVVSIPLFFFTYIAYYGVLLRLNNMYAVDIFRTNLFTGNLTY